jgi:enoyl-CoA hydratase/carnithine racemase
MTPLVHLKATGAQATITLDSPHNRNALSRQLVREVIQHLQAAELDDSVRVVLLRSSGRVFCSGANPSEATAEGMAETTRRVVELQRRIIEMSKPVVVEVAGAVRAGGIGVVAASDVALADDATFALTEVKLGLAPAIISMTVFDRMTPRSAALAMLGGEALSGVGAAASGLVTAALPAGELAAAVDRVCMSLATGSPQGLRESKRPLNRDLLARIDDRGDEMAAFSTSLFASKIAQTAMAEFLRKRLVELRPAAWRGPEMVRGVPGSVATKQLLHVKASSDRCTYGPGASWCARTDELFGVERVHLLDVTIRDDGTLVLDVATGEDLAGCASCGSSRPATGAASSGSMTPRASGGRCWCAGTSACGGVPNRPARLGRGPTPPLRPGPLEADRTCGAVGCGRAAP